MVNPFSKEHPRARGRAVIDHDYAFRAATAQVKTSINHLSKFVDIASAGRSSWAPVKTPHILHSPRRRVWFAGAALLAAAGLLAGCVIFHPHIFNNEAGLQLYSVRAQMAKDVPGTLAEVHAWGIKYVELAGTYGLSPKPSKPN